MLLPFSPFIEFFNIFFCFRRMVQFEPPIELNRSASARIVILGSASVRNLPRFGSLMVRFDRFRRLGGSVHPVGSPSCALSMHYTWCTNLSRLVVMSTYIPLVSMKRECLDGLEDEKNLLVVRSGSNI